jgi:tetratricopeptide (TPR) repeat protein
MRCIGVILIWACCVFAEQGQHVPGGAACSQLFRTVMAQAANRGFAEAGMALLADSANGNDGPGLSCKGLILTGLASRAAVSDRLADAATLAERALRLLEHEYPPDDPVLLRPLHVLAASRFGNGETARAREVFQRMQSIRIERPEDRVLVKVVGAWLLENEGRYREAESEYGGALYELERAGLGNTMDAGAVFNALGSLYIKEHRLDDAKRAIDRAVAISISAADAVPVDRMKALQTRGLLHARQREWAQAERDMRDALSIADGEPRTDPVVLASLLIDYAQVLRRNHHSREARSIEVRAARLHGNFAANAVVDVTELAAKPMPVKK